MERSVKVDLSELRERYRSCRDHQRTRTQVEHLRGVSDLAEVLVPVSQSLSPWKPQAGVPLAVDDHVTSDPWHEHLCLHRRSRPKNQAPPGPHRLSSSEAEGPDLQSVGPESLDQSRPEPIPAQSCSRPVFGLDQDQNHFPFPNRRTPRISETARRLGLYSSV